MADRQDDNRQDDTPLDGRAERAAGVDYAPPESPGALSALPPGVCPECASGRFTLIRDTEIVSVYKCSSCGSLAAPVKKS